MAGISIGIGASMAVTSLSILASVDVLTKLPPFFNSILNTFQNLGIVFVILGIVSIIVAWSCSKKDLQNKSEKQNSSLIDKCSACGNILPCRIHMNESNR